MRLEDVAKEAKVSLVTARKALRNDPSVRSYLRERVLNSVKELDYRPNLIARILKQSSSSLVSVTIPCLSNPYFGEMAKHITNELYRHNFEPVISESIDKVFNYYRSYNSCGCIVVKGFSQDEIVELKQNLKIVTVQGDAHIDGVPDISIDFTRAYCRLTELAVGLGRRRIAFFHEPYHQYTDSKFEAVEAYLQSNNLQPVKYYRSGFSSSDEIITFLTHNPGSIDTIFCQNDMFAAECIAILNTLGLKSPNDILVVGCDGTLPLRNVWTVKVGLKELAEKTVELFLKLHNGEQCSERIKMEASICV